VANALVTNLPPNELLSETSLAGPGFINIRLSKTFLVRAPSSGTWQQRQARISYTHTHHARQHTCTHTQCKYTRAHKHTYALCPAPEMRGASGCASLRGQL